MMARLMIADDHQLFREGLRRLLPSDEFEVVADVGSGRDAIREARRHEPDLALLDVSMPGLNGVDTAREVMRVSPRTRVVVLTMHRDDPYIVEALRAGARGYVLKTQSVTEQLAALRDVALGGVYVPQQYWRAVVESQQNSHEPSVDPLTPREREVLQLVAEGRTTKEIGATLNISFKTAESHRLRTMSKLGIHETASLVRYAIRRHMIEP